MPLELAAKLLRRFDKANATPDKPPAVGGDDQERGGNEFNVAAEKLQRIHGRLRSEHRKHRLIRELTALLERWNREVVGDEDTIDESE